MSESIESPDDQPEALESESDEQPEILESKPVEVAEPAEISDAYDLETVELPENFASEYPRNVDKFGPEPTDMICPECGATMTTRTSTETTSFGNVDSTSFFFACLNFCCGGIETIKHRCPECDAIVGTYATPHENTDNYRSGSPNNFITNNGVDHVITQQDEAHQVKCEATPNDDDDCLEVEDCDDDDEKLDSGDCDDGDDGLGDD
ncbi:unnamed protein product [Chironomus riparius]|uniref:LITAF domain-containing protein n=1 Tax=Chironomus riparius TaxID=315576 RepID=A0A9N9WXM6_9DIPT|nr:unnamed protein product [Chironomus riparius]